MCPQQWVLSIMPNRAVRDHWEFPSKMERHFPIKPGQPRGLALATVCFSTEFLNKDKELVCQKWNDKFRSEYSDRNKWTTSKGDPEYSGQKKPKRTFPFEFQPKFSSGIFGIMESTQCVLVCRDLQTENKVNTASQSQ